jgi:uncharacterized protein YbjT (DUF2867 family)
MKKILVIGATGTVGRAVISELLSSKADVHIRAFTRNADSANLPAQVQVFQGDLTNPVSLDSALAGADAVFLVWTAPPAAAPSTLAHITKRVRQIVFLSSPHQTPHPFFRQPNPLANLHAEIEHLIQSSGVRWTILRPGMFAANALHWWVPRIRANQNHIRWPYGDAPTAPIHERDIGAVGTRVLLEDSYTGKDYVLTGPQSLTQSQQVQIIGEVIGRPLRFEEISAEEADRELLSGIPRPAIRMLLNAWAAALGQPAYISDSVAQVIGVPPRTFRDWVTDHMADFQPHSVA